MNLHSTCIVSIYVMGNPYDLICARSDGSHEYARIRCTQEFHDLWYACITPSRPAEAKENARYGGRQRRSASMSMNGGVELGERMKQRRNWKLCACMCERD